MFPNDAIDPINYFIIWAKSLKQNIVAEAKPNNKGGLFFCITDYIHDKILLNVKINTDISLTPNDYKFDIREISPNKLIWRYDLHPGHPDINQRGHHVHVGPCEEDRRATEPVTLEDMGGLIGDTLAGKWNPNKIPFLKLPEYNGKAPVDTAIRCGSNKTKTGEPCKQPRPDGTTCGWRGH